MAQHGGGGQRTTTVVTRTILANGVKTVTVTRVHAPERKRTGKSASAWLAVEFMGIVVYKVASTIGHAMAEILMGRQP